jgi:hypothetical protein
VLRPKSSLSEFPQVTDNAAYCREGPCTLLEKAEQKLVRPNGTVVLPHAEVSSLVDLTLPAIVLAKVSDMLWEYLLFPKSFSSHDASSPAYYGFESWTLVMSWIPSDRFHGPQPILGETDQTYLTA